MMKDKDLERLLHLCETEVKDNLGIVCDLRLSLKFKTPLLNDCTETAKAHDALSRMTVDCVSSNSKFQLIIILLFHTYTSR